MYVIQHAWHISIFCFPHYSITIQYLKINWTTRTALSATSNTQTISWFFSYFARYSIICVLKIVIIAITKKLILFPARKVNTISKFELYDMNCISNAHLTVKEFPNRFNISHAMHPFIDETSQKMLHTHGHNDWFMDEQNNVYNS